MADRRPPRELLGLWVRFGDWRAPAAATFTCRHGCFYEAHGASEVAYLTHHAVKTHARKYPGAPQDDRPTRGPATRT